MLSTAPAGEPAKSVGALLRGWRTTRRLSQLELALTAEVSARHLSFLETGRARPSRQMLLVLASVLDIPLRERNALLQAAGFADVYRETPLDDPEMAGIRQALELLLRHHEPFPAVALDRHWNVVMVNESYARFLAALLGRSAVLPSYTVVPAPRPNALRRLFDPQAVRPHVVNWTAVARGVLERVHREARWNGDAATHALLSDLLSAPDVPADWREANLESRPSLVVPVELRVGEHAARFFTTMTTLGAPQDITLQELRIESFHPADAATAELVRQMAAQP